jgi:hypothetical protein
VRAPGSFLPDSDDWSDEGVGEAVPRKKNKPVDGYRSASQRKRKGRQEESDVALGKRRPASASHKKKKETI